MVTAGFGVVGVSQRTRPVLLDLFCGAGGATAGYQRAGFHVIGIDIDPQPNYCGDEFIQDDALAYLSNEVELLRLGQPYWPFVAAHASPPCQHYSAMSSCRPGLAEKYPDLIAQTRELLTATGLPYVIENVPGAPLHNPVMLCGQMVGLDLYRHRLFESNVHLWQPEHPRHTVAASRAGHWKPGTIMSISGHVSPIAEARRAMGIDWMNRDELAEAIPPAYTDYIGAQLLDAIEVAA